MCSYQDEINKIYNERGYLNKYKKEYCEIFDKQLEDWFELLRPFNQLEPARVRSDIIDIRGKTSEGRQISWKIKAEKLLEWKIRLETSNYPACFLVIKEIESILNYGDLV